jgi:DNA polymerase V
MFRTEGLKRACSLQALFIYRDQLHELFGLEISMINTIHIPDYSTEYRCPLFMVPVTAGFPSPADDYIEGTLDLNKHLIKHPAATFFVRVTGDSMIRAGIHPGDILIVDRSLDPGDKKIVIAVVDGELTVKRLRLHNDKVTLEPENDNYPTLTFAEGNTLEIWGVVTSVIHPL